MVRAPLRHCFFCCEDFASERNLRDHCEGLDRDRHMFSLRHVFSDSSLLWEVVERMCPTRDERRHIQNCLRDLEAALGNQNIEVTGSIGKDTALHSCLDLDVVVYTNEKVRVLAERLENSPYNFEVDHVTKHPVVLARYGFRTCVSSMEQWFEIDILPMRLDVDPLVGALGHVRHFKSLPTWRRVLVKLLKGWSRAIVHIPGVLLETVVEQISSGEYVNRQTFAAAISLLMKDSDWPDPRNAENKPQTSLNPSEWRVLRGYAKETLDAIFPVVHPGSSLEYRISDRHSFGDEWLNVGQSLVDKILWGEDSIHADLEYEFCHYSVLDSYNNELLDVLEGRPAWYRRIMCHDCPSPGRRGHRKRPTATSHRAAIPLPKDRVGRVIGMAGCNFKKIRNDTGVELSVDDDHAAIVIHAASQQALEKATAEVLELASDAADGADDAWVWVQPDEQPLVSGFGQLAYSCTA